MIDLTINKTGLQHNIEKAKENHVIIPTIAQMQNPDLIPEKVKAKLTGVGLWDVNPLNLFRINWHNEAKEFGGLYQPVPNYVEIPSSLSGVPCRIVAMAGKWFPTGCHKVGASFGCLAPRLVTGQFDATYHHAVWPSTGNYCRGGAFNSKLLACDSVAILPAEMSKERFEWLSKIAGQVIATPGCESNVKEIFDKTWELKQDPAMMIFNQFEEMGNPLWHYNVTGYALSDVFEAIKKPGQRFAGACFTSGSAGTMSAGDLLKECYPGLKLGVGEALQCPTILDNGFGGHRIEGIGDKHIPWIHNVKNTDMAIAIDDEDSQRLLRLFNTPEGQKYLKDELGLDDELIEKLTWLGISGIANVLHQDGEVLRAHRERRGGYRPDRLRRHVPVPHHRAQRDARRVQRPRGGTGSQPAYAGSEDRQHARAALHRPQAHPQPEVLHLGRAAGQGRQRPQRPLVQHKGNVGRRPRAGEGARRPDQRVQRRHGRTQGAVKIPSERRRGRDIRPVPCLLCELFCFCVGPATESARQPPAAYFLPAAAKVCKKRRLNLRFKNPLARPVPCRSLRCVPYGWKFYARGIKCSIVSAPAPLPLTV